MLNTIDEALADIRRGRFVIVVDDEDRENEGDFVAPAEVVTPEMIAFMLRRTSGIICAPLTEARAAELDLPMMVDVNTARHGTPFTVSIDYVHGTTTGVSASDRAVTVRALTDPKTKATDFARPGHIFPLRAVDEGVLRRAGHTEAAVDLARLAGFKEVAILCEIMNEDGTMARLPDLKKVAVEYDMKIISVQDLIKYRTEREKLVEKIVEVNLPTYYGEFKLHLYRNKVDGKEHIALTKGNISGEPVLVRVHSECFTGDTLGSLRCDCQDQLHAAMMMVEREGRGIVLYMRQEGRGIGLANKLKAYKLQEEGKDTVEANEALGFKADLRDYGIGAQILVDLGVRKMRLLTNNPKKIVGLGSYGLEVVDRVPIEVPANENNASYLETKRKKLGHMIGADSHSVEAMLKSLIEEKP
ncbi:MAG: bifunctional 3,4-dihydroxy-2-butanone-4-phosphate synthase/GTP cyclohydrolase II [Bacteroidota bacterium]|nr:bifunctional 3,4-dihydroxy-2-butanone-4-phosphate synthase/GTP cyclohydrolase II [Bacteroidota bacterium]MDP4237026.1 bifunctional 3,4-dihydroxy-2-butanone-4-phosphate synthase/GTP cyclohydrolase II [Bacteroidota bacterium]